MQTESYSHIFLRAVGAGSFLALAGAASVFASATAPILKALIFPFGLIIIYYFRFLLFTGAVATVPMNKYYGSNLTIIWFGNFIGAVLASLIIYLSCGDLCADKFIAIYHTKLSGIDGTFGEAIVFFLKLILLGFACNILIAGGIVVANRNAGTAPVILYIAVFLFIICNFEHSVANMFFLSYGSLLEKHFMDGAILLNILPVTIGNFLGGLAVVGYRRLK